MILILYPKSDLSTQKFINFLVTQNVPHLALDIDSDVLRSNLIIEDKYTECTWSWPQHMLKLNFNLLTGIYNRVYALDYLSFLDYSNEDIEYVQKEWGAYLTYRMKALNNCINPPSHGLMSGRSLDFPYFYTLAKKIGLKVPEYFISTSFLELRTRFESGKEYIALDSLFLNNKFLPSKTISERDIALIERIKGKLVLIHVVDQNFYCCTIEKDKKFNFELPNKYQDLIRKLKENLNINVIQVFMVQTSSDLFLLNVSLFPNWEFNTDYNRNKIFLNLISLLSKNKE